MPTLTNFTIRKGQMPDELKAVIAAQGMTVPFDPNGLHTAEPVGEWVKLKHGDTEYIQDEDLTFKPI